MGRALLLFPVFIEDALYFHFHILPAGLHDLDRLSHGELVALLDPAESVFYLSGNAEIGVLFIVCVAVIDLCGLVRLPEEKSRGELPVSTV